MLGGIYCDQKCPICGQTLVDHGPAKGIHCPAHKSQKATRCRVKFPQTKPKRFSGDGFNLRAHQYLGGLRAKVGDPDTHGHFDSRDYDDKNKPLSFTNLVDIYIEKREGHFKSDKLSESHYRNIKNCLNQAKERWGHSNIKSIGFAEIEDWFDFLASPKDPGIDDTPRLKSKSISNFKSILHAFFEWVTKRYSTDKIKIEIPEFPETPFVLDTRTIIDKETQIKILDLIKSTHQDQPRKWIAVQWLARYSALRPDDIRRIREKDVDYNSGRVIIVRPTKNKKSRTIWLLDEDLELIRELPRGLPDMYVFRHDRAWPPKVKAGDRFGKDLLAEIWDDACTKLGVVGVTIYPGTRHSTVTALQEHLTPDQIKSFSQHETNAAFERYMHPARASQINIAGLAASSPKKPKKGKKVVNLKKP